MKLMTWVFVFLGPFTSIPGHAIELNRRSLLKALGLGGVAAAQPAATAAALLTPTVTAAPVAPVPSVPMVQTAAAIFRKQAIAGFYNEFDNEILNDFDRLKTFFSFEPNYKDVLKNKAVLSAMEALDVSWDYRGESIDAVRHFVSNNPSKVSDEQRALLSKIEGQLQDEKARIARHPKAEHFSQEVGRRFTNDRRSSTTRDLVQTLIETLKSNPEFSPNFSIYFKGQLHQLEQEIAQELRVEFVQVEKAIELLSPRKRLQLLTSQFDSDARDSMAQIPFSQEFIDLYLHKLRSFGPEFAASVENLNTTFIKVLELDPLTCLRLFGVRDYHVHYGLRRGIHLRLQHDLSQIDAPIQAFDVYEKDLLKAKIPKALMASPMRFEPTKNSLRPTQTHAPIAPLEREEIARAYVQTLDYLNEFLENTKLLPPSHLTTSPAAAIEKTVIDVTFELKTLPQRLDALEIAGKKVERWAWRHKAYDDPPFRYTRSEPGQFIQELVDEDPAALAQAIETALKLPSWASPDWLTFDMENTGKTAVQWTQWLSDLERLGAKREVLELPLPSVETLPPSELQPQLETESDVTKDTECQHLLTDQSAKENASESAESKDSI